MDTGKFLNQTFRIRPWRPQNLKQNGYIHSLKGKCQLSINPFLRWPEVLPSTACPVYPVLWQGIPSPAKDGSSQREYPQLLSRIYLERSACMGEEALLNLLSHRFCLIDHFVSLACTYFKKTGPFAWLAHFEKVQAPPQKKRNVVIWLFYNGAEF